MFHHALIFCGTLCMPMVVCLPSWAQVFDERFDDWPTNLRINGRVFVASELNGLKMFDDLTPHTARQQSCLLLESNLDSTLVFDVYSELFPKVIRRSVDQIANLESQELPEYIGWQPDTFNAADAIETGRFLAAQLHSGKTLMTAGSAARWLGKYYVENSRDGERLRCGLDVLPDCLLALNFVEDDSRKLLDQLTLQPRTVGIGLAANTGLILTGRKLRVAGEGQATLSLAANDRSPPRTERLLPRHSLDEEPSRWLADLTQWRREAIDRTLPAFPPTEPQSPHLPAGTLVIVGGGGLPDGLMERFVELAGGRQSAKLVYIPCEEADTVPIQPSLVETWLGLGVQHATWLHTKDRLRAHTDEEFLRPLAEATGIWFGGGRQWNLADSYYGTHAHRLMKQVLQRGGVIGGSSAGASIQARYLARATPIENVRIMAPGYERGGLGFLSGVAIDQHFSQRGRQRDMSELVARYPQLLGIGIDETTALVVHQSVAEVVGRGDVYFYDRRRPLDNAGQPEFEVLAAGHKYDLAARRSIP